MEDLNQFAISRTLGSRIRHIGPVGFGNFSLRSTTEEMQAAFAKGREEDAHEDAGFGYEQDAVVVRAFENVRHGAPTDELLWNKKLACDFVQEARNLGLEAAPSYLIRRLINVRKNAPRYKQHGIEISPTKKTEQHPSIVSKHAHVIEFALVRLRYRYGASIDDILMDPALGQKFEEMAQEIVPDISEKDLRLGALYIRKNRVLKKSDYSKFEDLDTSIIDKAWEGSSSLASIGLQAVPAAPGLIELKEPSRYLYVSHNKDIRAAVSQLKTGLAFKLVANSFWRPNLDTISVSYVHGEKVAGVGIGKWECKLVYDHDPVFNWPMPKKDAA